MTDLEDSQTSHWEGRTLHFVGIGGAGMSGLAILASSMGAEVSGSDASESIFTRSLRRHDRIRLTIGHGAENVPDSAEVVYSSAIAADNVERAHARSRGQAELHRSGLLAQLTEVCRTVAVAGAHGKTTTSALLSHVLTEVSAQIGGTPSYIIGGLMGPPAPHAAAGASDVLVIEADESDRSLLNYDVAVAVVTNIDLDHVADAAGYSTRADVRDVMRQFADSAEVTVADPEVMDELDPANERVVARVRSLGAGHFEVDGHTYATNLPGEHNVANAGLVVTTALYLGGAPVDIARALSSFPGLRRRFELRGTTAQGARVFDDYAHHPTEVASAIRAARTLTSGPVVAVFQPHLYSRTSHFAADFAQALSEADLGLLDEIYPAREKQDDFPDVTSGLIAAALPTVRSIEYPPSTADLVARITEAASSSDAIVLLLGAGSIGKLADEIVTGE